MSIHTASYTLGQAAAATNLSPNTLRTWYQRGHMMLNKNDKAPEAEGLARIVTGRTVLQIAITAALVNYGMSVAHAFRAAAAFAVVGDRRDGIERDPGQLWGKGCLSMLVVPGGEAGAEHADVVRWSPKDGFMQMVAHLNFHKTGGIMLPLDNLVDAVRKNLGLGPDRGGDA